MPSKSSTEDLPASRAKLEGGLQVLFQSLTEEWENTKNKKNEELDAVMSKWVEGVRDLLEKTDIIPGKAWLPHQLSTQAKNLPSFEKPLSRKKAVQPVIGQAETQEMLRIIAKLRGDVEPAEKKLTAPRLPLLLEVLEVKEGKRTKPLLIPVRLKNLYQGMIVLGVDNLKLVNKPNALHGKEAILRFRDPKSQESMDLCGTMALTHSMFDKKIDINLAIQDSKTIKMGIKILENSLPDASKAHQLLWNLWEKTQEIQEAGPDADDKLTNAYLLLLACATILTSFMNPVLYQTMEYTLASLGLGKIIKFIRER